MEASEGRAPLLLRQVLGLLAGVSLFAMMSLTFVDVIGRKFFNQSIIGSVELTELTMLGVIFCGLPLATLAGEHVIFDLFDGVLSDDDKRWQGVVANLISGVLLMVAAWFVFERAGRTLSMGDVTAQLTIPVAPFHYLAAGLIAVGALLHFYLASIGRRGA